MYYQYLQLNADGTPIVESEIISWANNKLLEGGKEVSIKHFQDKTNKTSLPIIHLIDVIKPGVIDYSFVTQGESMSKEVGPGAEYIPYLIIILLYQDCLSNAKYAVTMARKIGAPVYALPEDISEVRAICF